MSHAGLASDCDEPAARIFLSYHKRNYALATSIVASIESGIEKKWPAGPRVAIWFDKELQAGEQWDPRIQLEIERADILLFLVTHACLSATYMWSDEFQVALDRFRAGEGRVRLVPVIYSDASAPIRTNRHTRGLNYIPEKPHDQMADRWLEQVVNGVLGLVDGVISQREPPTRKLVTAFRNAGAALEAAQTTFSVAAPTGFFGPVPASDINNFLGAFSLAIGLPARERMRALSVWEPKLRDALVRLRGPLPVYAEKLRVLREAIDELVTFGDEESVVSQQPHVPTVVPAEIKIEFAEKVKNEISAVRRAFSDMSASQDAPSAIENEAREHAVEIGTRHTALAQALLEEQLIDAAALSSEVGGVGAVARGYANTLTELGSDASRHGKRLSKRLSRSANLASEITGQLVQRAKTRAPQRDIIGQTPETTPVLDDEQTAVPYHVYTTEYDQTVSPAELVDAKELSHLAAKLAGMSNRLTSFDFYERFESVDRTFSSFAGNLTVTLLIDNSGSMRGHRIIVTALAAFVLSEFFDRCGVSCEVLGFTTKAWKGGMAKEDWIRAGRPPLPGRLNDLRHIIYKSAGESFQSASDNFGLMLLEGLLKENIDGEAVTWAAERLKSRPEARKALIVISDGSPVDDATLSANPGDLLGQHLHSVVADLQSEGAIELFAIGIDHEVSRFYGNGVRVNDVDRVGEALADILLLLNSSGPSVLTPK